MGRSNLQGTAWHYEYVNGGKVNNSKNCVFNTGIRCSCKISPNHNMPCVGKRDCEEFERSSFRGKINTKEKEMTSSIVNTDKNKCNHKKEDRKTVNKVHENSRCVKIGSKVKVMSLNDGECIDIGTISSIDNPFYLRKVDEIVTIRDIKYKVTKIY